MENKTMTAMQRIEESDMELVNGGGWYDDFCSWAGNAYLSTKHWFRDSVYMPNATNMLISKSKLQDSINTLKNSF